MKTITLASVSDLQPGDVLTFGARAYKYLGNKGGKGEYAFVSIDPNPLGPLDDRMYDAEEVAAFARAGFMSRPIQVPLTLAKEGK